jgi:hypothetical protein
MAHKEPPNVTPDSVARVVMLVYGLMSNSNPFWCFVAVKPSRYKELQDLVAKKTFDIRTYEADGFGEIVVSGEGVTPPTEVVTTVAKMFDVPVKKLFDDTNPDEVIAKEVERVKKETKS